jgi:hypothetical protein
MNDIFETEAAGIPKSHITLHAKLGKIDTISAKQPDRF